MENVASVGVSKSVGNPRANIDQFKGFPDFLCSFLTSLKVSSTLIEVLLILILFWLILKFLILFIECCELGTLLKGNFEQPFSLYCNEELTTINVSKR